MPDFPLPPGSSIPPPPPASDITTPANIGRGVLYGVGAGIVGGLLWYFVVAGTKRQFMYGALILGLFIGWAVVKGAGRQGAATALTAAVIAALTVAVTYFYIDRYLIIKAVEDDGLSAGLGLIPTWDEFTSVLEAGFKAEKSQWISSVIAVLAAAWIGFRGNSPARRRS